MKSIKVNIHSNQAVTLEFGDGTSLYVDVSIPEDGIILNCYHEFNDDTGAKVLEENEVIIGKVINTMWK